MSRKYCYQYFFVSLVLLFITQVSHAKTEDPSSLSAIVAKHVKEGMDQGKDLKNLHKILTEALGQNPNSPSLNYQLARYILKTGSIQDKSLIGYHYKQDKEKEAVDILNKVINIDPSNGEAYSLLGNIYSLQNKLIDAEKYLTKARATNKHIPWLSFNQALFYIRKNDMSKAASLLNQIAKSRPPKNRNALQNQYYSAWVLLKKIALKNPQFDPNETVRKGFAKRISPENINKYITNNKSDKLTFIHFSSNDTWCKPCINNDKNVAKVAQKFHSDVNFIHVSFEPWDTINHFNNNLKTFKITGLPSNHFYSQGKSIGVQPGEISSKSFEKFIVEKLQNINTGETSKPVNKKEKVLISGKFKNAVKKLVTKEKNRAAAVAIDSTGKWTFQRSYGYKDIDKVKKAVLDRCKKKKAERAIKSNCVLYAINNKFVYQDATKEVLNTLKSDFKAMK